MHRILVVIIAAAPAVAQQSIWTTTSPLSYAPEGYAQTLLADGRVLVTGARSVEERAEA
jgi:hypothetical protein